MCGQVENLKADETRRQGRLVTKNRGGRSLGSPSNEEEAVALQAFAGTWFALQSKDEREGPAQLVLSSAEHRDVGVLVPGGETQPTLDDYLRAQSRTREPRSLTIDTSELDPGVLEFEAEVFLRKAGELVAASSDEVKLPKNELSDWGHLT